MAVVRVSAVDFATVIGVDGGAPGSRTGLQALLDVDEVSFIAIPGVATPAVQTAMIDHCTNAGDRMAILDPAVPDDFDAIQVQRAGLVTENGFAALYFPWIQAEPTEVSLLLPPSGFVAGYYSASDPPDSPVGVIATATAVAFDMTSEQQDLLNVQNINAIRNLSGIRIWGARTLAGSNEWKYVAVRRLGFYIEESIAEGTEWCLTEPNDISLWTSLEQDMDIFMYGLYVQGWLQGATPGDAYFVQCGLGTTMAQVDIDQGLTIMSVGFAPLIPAEFVVLDIVHQREDMSAAPNAPRAPITLLPPAPNPFNPTTNLRFEVAYATTMDLDIYDAGGRLVRTLMKSQPLAAGDHQIRWNGRDDAGRAVGSGSIWRGWWARDHLICKGSSWSAEKDPPGGLPHLSFPPGSGIVLPLEYFDPPRSGAPP